MLFWETCNTNWNLNITSYKPFWLLSHNSKIRLERFSLVTTSYNSWDPTQTSQTTNNQDFHTSNIESPTIDWLYRPWCSLICIGTAALQATQWAPSCRVVQVQPCFAEGWRCHQFVEYAVFFWLNDSGFCVGECQPSTQSQYPLLTLIYRLRSSFSRFFLSTITVLCAGGRGLQGS